MNETIEKLLSHHSVRKFTEEKLTTEQIHTLVKSAQAASTSSYIQAYTILGIKDIEKKKRLSELAGNQPYVINNGHFFIFCADLYRHELIGEREAGDVIDSLESTEKFMVAIIDAALAAQNAVVAAESMGLGICYIGGIRNNLEAVSELLELPDRVIPLFGLAVGYPEEHTGVKPRLPLHHIYQEDRYDSEPEKIMSELEEYNKTVSSYYETRTNGKRNDRWTAQMSKMLSSKKRMYMKDFVEKKKFNKQ
ncbi:oxygen-insensitive NADPH nitroreductase [Rossellomorea sp. BNER]|uniref:oxygen-insensitive NADPH nitroreductase n=1 Tax=Rossellomorea sp. BNER TaxID=2962031 RepID=UPI003AF2B988|nr:oxygen-insensitive NADPH nitroreductase [Rossellomorea sp. BNER]